MCNKGCEILQKGACELQVIANCSRRIKINSYNDAIAVVSFPPAFNQVSNHSITTRKVPLKVVEFKENSGSRNHFLRNVAK